VLATDLQLRHLVIASNCLQVIKNLKEEFVGSYSVIIDEIKAWTKDFTSVVFRHENRVSNSEAHCVARSFISASSGRQVWLLDPPADLCIPMIIDQ
jgi:hypothetical protein